MARIYASQISELVADLQALQSMSPADVTAETLTPEEIAIVFESRRKRLLLRLENRGLTIAADPETRVTESEGQAEWVLQTLQQARIVQPMHRRGAGRGERDD
jgi:hypothetical protein